MSAAAQMDWKLLGCIPKRIKSMEHGFLGSSWSFVVCEDGTAYWINVETGTIVESSRNTGKE